jgi:DNA-binding protein H-NS
MKTLASVLAKIEALQAEAEKLRKRERAEVIQRIQTAIIAYKITPDELVSTKKAKASPKAKAATKTGKSVQMKGRIKYADGYGNTWSGYGPPPKWIRDATADGTPRDSFLQAA